MPYGYFVPNGYMELTSNGFMLFVSDSEYLEYIAEHEKES